MVMVNRNKCVYRYSIITFSARRMTTTSPRWGGILLWAIQKRSKYHTHSTYYICYMCVSAAVSNSCFHLLIELIGSNSYAEYIFLHISIHTYNQQKHTSTPHTHIVSLRDYYYYYHHFTQHICKCICFGAGPVSIKWEWYCGSLRSTQRPQTTN